MSGVLSWRAALDVLIIASGVFILYTAIERSRAWRLVIGIAFAALIFVLAQALDLYTIEWVYSHLSSIVLIALVVIFQPELRRMLAQFASLPRQGIPDGVDALAGLISEAAFALAADRRGAILVFPGRDFIWNHVSEGFPLRGLVTQPLLLSIFDASSPGHDGAVIISDGLVHSFGVRLPLSRSAALSHEYGTRHHASLGISELTDALAIAVSEEKGTVSGFHQGQFEPLENSEKLRRRILLHWEAMTIHPIRAKGFRRRHFLLKTAVSLSFACLLWWLHGTKLAGVTERGFIVPVEYINIPRELAIAGAKATQARIYVSGPPVRLAQLDPADLRVSVDLSNAGSGQEEITIDEQKVTLPEGVKLRDAEPPALRVTLLPLERREAIVHPTLAGSTRPGKRIVEVRTTPDKVDVMSPSDNERKKPLVIGTMPIEISGLTETATVTVRASAAPPLRPVGDAWPEITVHLRIEDVR